MVDLISFADLKAKVSRSIYLLSCVVVWFLFMYLNFVKKVDARNKAQLQRRTDHISGHQRRPKAKDQERKESAEKSETESTTRDVAHIATHKTFDDQANVECEHNNNADNRIDS